MMLGELTSFFDLILKFLLGGILLVVCFGVIMLILNFIEKTMMWFMIVGGFIMVMFAIAIFCIISYTIGDALINGTFWELVNGMV